MEIKVTTRTVFGKKLKRLRDLNLVPGEIYGHGFQNMHISVHEKDLKKQISHSGEHGILNLVLDDKEKIQVIISDVVHNYLKGKILAVDFHRIRKDEKIKTKVPIEFTGEDNAAKNGFLFVKVLEEIEIEALPDFIPNSFSVDISNLSKEGDGISVEDLKISKEIKLITHKESVIATVTEKAKEEKQEVKETVEIPQEEKVVEEEKPEPEKQK